MVIVVCPHCGSQLVFAGRYQAGRRPCVNCKREIAVPEKPMSEDEARAVLKQAKFGAAEES